MSNTVRENARLPRARARDYEKGAVDVQNGLALCRIEVGQEIFMGRDAHASMLAALSEWVAVASTVVLLQYR